MTVVWEDASTANYTAEAAVVNGHTVCVCLDNEAVYVGSTAYYWNIDDKRGVHDGVWFDGWAGSVEDARRDALAAAEAML